MKRVLALGLALVVAGCAGEGPGGSTATGASATTGTANAINGLDFQPFVKEYADALKWPNGEEGFGYGLSTSQGDGLMTVSGTRLRMQIDPAEARELGVGVIQKYPVASTSHLGFLLYSDDGWDEKGVHTPLVQCGPPDDRVNLFTSVTIDYSHRMLTVNGGKAFSFEECGISEHLFNNVSKLFELFVVPTDRSGDDYAYRMDIKWSDPPAGAAGE